MHIPLSAKIEHLLPPLYDAVLAPTGFQDFIRALCDAFPLKAASLLSRHTDTLEMKGKGLWTHGIADEWMESYALEYAPEDLLARHMMASPIASFYASNLDLAHPERFIETRFYREWIVPQGVAYAAAGIVLREGAWETQLFLQRAAHQPPFVRDELNQLNRLVPHLQRALQMRQRLADLQLDQTLLPGSLDILAMPTLLFDEYCRVAHTNRSADALLNAHDSLWLENNHLFTRDAATMRSLNLELANAIRGDGAELTGVVLLKRSGQMPLMLMIAPLRLSAAGPTLGAALVFAFDPNSTPKITSSLVRRLFGLSDAEADLAAALCRGKTLDDAASERSTSIHTTRSQLKSIFNKTGTKRQADLISLLLASPAYFLAKSGAE